MANPHRGDVDVEIDGTTYTLRLTTNALAELEDLLGEPIGVIAGRLNDPARVTLSLVRGSLWAALRKHHGGLTVDDVGELIDEITLPGAMDVLGKAFERAFPAPEAGDDARPRKGARAGTGRRS